MAIKVWVHGLVHYRHLWMRFGDKGLFALLLPLIANLSLPSCQSWHKKSPNEIAASATPCVVRLMMSKDTGELVGLGSGFFISSDTIVTNAHVANAGERYHIEIITKAGSQVSIEADRSAIVAIDNEADLAVIKSGYREGAFLPLGNPNYPNVGSTVYAFGAPLGLDHTFSSGNISAIREFKSYSRLQITTPISPGSSGGPLLNDQGEVVGVVVSTISEAQNVNFAVPVKDVKRLLKQATTPPSISDAEMLAAIESARPEVKREFHVAKLDDWSLSFDPFKKINDVKARCLKGDEEACDIASEVLELESTPSSYRAFFESVCKVNIEGCVYIALLDRHEGYYQKAKHILDAGCTAGHARSCLELGHLSHYDKSGPDVYYMKACQMGLGDACSWASQTKGIEDKSKFDLERKACLAGSVAWCEQLLSDFGSQISQQEQSKLEMEVSATYHKRCASGHFERCREILPETKSTQIRFYKYRCDHGDQGDCNSLAAIWNELNQAKEYGLAMKKHAQIRQRLCTEGITEINSTCVVCKSHSKGEGICKERLRKACQNGDESMCSILKSQR